MNSIKDLRQVLTEQTHRMQPPPGLESRMLHLALDRNAAQPRAAGSVRTPRLAALVAVLLAVAIVAALVFATRAFQSNRTVPGVPAPGPLVYFQRAPVSGWQAIDWKGAGHGTVGSDHVGNPYQSPDGSRILWYPNDTWQIVDRHGHTLSSPDLSRSRAFTWADDSSGLCVVNVISAEPPNGGTYQLEFVSSTGGSRIISTLATKKGPNLSACSPRSGRMVITTASGAKDRVTQQTRIGFGEIDVIDFKTGHVLFRHDFSPGEVDAMPISHDGLLAALGTQFRFTVVSLVDGHVVSQAPAATPLGFSWDDRLLVANGAANRGELIDVPTGQVVWIDPTAEVTQGAASEPDGSDVMMFVTTGGLSDLVVVSAGTGTGVVARVIARNVLPDQVAPCFNCSAF